LKSGSLIVLVVFLAACIRPVTGACEPVGSAPDTVEIWLAVPDSLPQPVTIYVVQDTVIFGGRLDILVDYALASPPTDRAGVEVAGDLLAPVRPPRLGDLDVSALPAVSGTRTVQSFRVYTKGVIRLGWHGVLLPGVWVQSRLTEDATSSAVRDPRGLQWRPWRIVVAAVLVALLVCGLIIWRRRRTQAAPMEHWPLADPAWMRTAVDLQELLAGDLLPCGEGALFLDRLAVLVRNFVVARYHIGAREMTGREIVWACTALGHKLAAPRAFADLLDEADSQRYRPEAPEANLCREYARRFFAGVDEARLRGWDEGVAAPVRLAADQAWSAMASEMKQDLSATKGGR